MIYTSHEQLANTVSTSEKNRSRVGVIAANDEHTMEAVLHGVEQGIATPIFFGNKAHIQTLLQSMEVKKDAFEIVHVDSPEESAKQAGLAAYDGRVDFLMKGGITTSTMLRALFDAQTKFRIGKLISHVAFVQIPTYHKIFAVSDVAITVYPTLDQKVALIKNAVETMLAMGFDRPKVAVLAASESVDSKILETVEAHQLQEMNRQGLIANCVVEGPLSLDLAMSSESSTIKKIDSHVAGDADLLLVPNIAAGNILIKCLRVCAKGRVAGLVAGGRVPIALSSRAAAATDKFLPLALAAAASQREAHHED